MAWGVRLRRRAANHQAPSIRDVLVFLTLVLLAGRHEAIIHFLDVGVGGRVLVFGRPQVEWIIDAPAASVHGFSRAQAAVQHSTSIDEWWRDKSTPRRAAFLARVTCSTDSAVQAHVVLHVPLHDFTSGRDAGGTEQKSPFSHWQALVFGHTFGELNAHKRLVRKAGKREDRKPGSLLEEKGRAVKEPEDDRGRPAGRYRSHPSKHTD